MFPVLYATSSHGKRKVWSVAVVGSDVTVTHGYAGGHMVTHTKTVGGKNAGRANATTPEAQARLEAQSLWNKKRVTYAPAAPAAPAALAAAPAASAAPPPLPMLAHDFKKRGKGMRFPCLAQRKLDGVRCVAVVGATVTLSSRTGKPFGLPHITDALRQWPPGIYDGELYSDTLTFQDLVGKVRTGDAAIYFCVYDTIRDGPFVDRWTGLAGLPCTPALRILETVPCERDHVQLLHDAYVAEGYEGLILRNREGLYTSHRSVDLQKYKEFEDHEFRVVGFKDGDGEKGCVIWLCVTAEGREFAVRPRGSREERARLFQQGAAYLGLLLTVRYQELTSDGLPRFPVGIAFRED